MYNVYYKMVIRTILADIRPMSTSIMTTNENPQQSTQDQLNDGRETVCYDTYIQLSHHYQQFLRNCESKSD